MILEIDGTEEYNVLKNYSFGRVFGDYRIVKYDEYYALQKIINKEWVTVLVSPMKGIEGCSFIMDIMRGMIDAEKSYNGEYWELKLFLSDEGEEYFTEIITKGDGETLLEQINELYELEKEQRVLYLETFPHIKIYEYAFYIACIFCLILLVHMLV